MHATPLCPTGLLALVQIYYSIDLFTPSLATVPTVYVRKYTTVVDKHYFIIRRVNFPDIYNAVYFLQCFQIYFTATNSGSFIKYKSKQILFETTN